MGSAAERKIGRDHAVRTARPGRGLRLLAVLFGAGLVLCLSEGVRAQSGDADFGAAAFAGLTEAELEATFDQLDGLGGFFSALSERDTNGFARERWRRLGVNYRSTAALLHDLLARGELVIDDLPPGRSSALSDDGRIVIDSRLDGRWSSDALQVPAAGDVAVRRRDLLEPVLMQALARRYLSQDWQWLADHLRAVGALGDLAQDAPARPLLARFFQAKDAYLWLALQRVAEGDPEARMALARRQATTFESIRNLHRQMAAAFGAEPAGQLQRDWADYVARVDGFAATRGWVLLDPALRRTQIGTAARREADALDRAAAEMVAAAPRSAVAAAGGIELKKQAAASSAATLPGVNLAAVIPAPETPSLAELAAGLPLDVLALWPEAPATAGSSAAFRAFAARVKEALAQPDPRQIIAEQEAALGAAEGELAALQARVGELDRGLRQRSEAAAALEAALAAERARLAKAERRAAEQAATAESLTAEVEALSALEGRVAELDAALTARAAQTESLESALAAERARLAAAEQRASEQAAVAENLSERVGELTAMESRLEELDSALAARNQEAEALAAALEAERLRLAEAERRSAEALAAAERAQAEAAAPVQPSPDAVAEAPRDGMAAGEEAQDLAALLLRIEQRQLLLIGAIAVIFLLGLLLWLRSRSRSRHSAAAPAPLPLLLTASVAEAEPRPVIDLVEAPAPSDDAAAGFTPQPASLKTGGAGPRIYGVAPRTREARAAMKAGNVRAEAARAAELGSESDAAAHPIVQALRKGNLPLFELLFSELTGLRAPRLQRIVYGGHGEDLAIVCRAVDIDKLLFGSIYLLTDSFRGGDADEESDRTAEILRMYDRMPPATAKKVLAKWQRDWGGEALHEEEESLA